MNSKWFVGIVAQWVRLPWKMPAVPFRVLVWVPATTLPTQLPAKAPGEQQVKAYFSAATHVRDLADVPGSWFGAWPNPSYCGYFQSESADPRSPPDHSYSLFHTNQSFKKMDRGFYYKTFRILDFSTKGSVNVLRHKPNSTIHRAQHYGSTGWSFPCKHQDPM